MNKVKPRHPRTLITKPSAQGSKRKATEGEDEGLGQAPDPSRSSQPNAEKEDGNFCCKQTVLSLRVATQKLVSPDLFETPPQRCEA